MYKKKVEFCFSFFNIFYFEHLAEELNNQAAEKVEAANEVAADAKAAGEGKTILSTKNESSYSYSLF